MSVTENHNIRGTITLLSIILLSVMTEVKEHHFKCFVVRLSSCGPGRRAKFCRCVFSAVVKGCKEFPVLVERAEEI